MHISALIGLAITVIFIIFIIQMVLGAPLAVGSPWVTWLKRLIVGLLGFAIIVMILNHFGIATGIPIGW